MKVNVSIPEDGNPNNVKITDQFYNPVFCFALNYTISAGRPGELTLYQTGGFSITAEAKIVNPTDVADLRLRALRGANVARLPEFRDKNGNICHTHPLGHDWPLSKWMNAILGELGEAANIIKKIERGDLTIDEARESLSKEFADVLCYLDIACIRSDIDLGEATINKFNEVSKRVGSSVRLNADQWCHSWEENHISYTQETDWAECPGGSVAKD